MQTQQAQIKINLPLPLKKYLETKANKFGMPIAGYVKHLILKDVSDMDYPVYQASELTEKTYQQARKEEKDKKLVQVDNLETFFDSL